MLHYTATLKRGDETRKLKLGPVSEMWIACEFAKRGAAKVRPLGEWEVSDVHGHDAPPLAPFCFYPGCSDRTPAPDGRCWKHSRPDNPHTI